MTDLQKEFEATGYTSWINADLYPDGKIYTQEYTQWLEKQVLALRQPPVSGNKVALRPFTRAEIKKATDETIEGFGPAYHEAVYLFQKGMKKAIKVLNKRAQ